MDKKIADYTKKERDLLLYSKPQKVALKMGRKTLNLSYEGVIEKFTTPRGCTCPTSSTSCRSSTALSTPGTR